ncbi:MAG: hypothetical protein HY013_04160 [Candidatus Solibacter usitatus]|nr:hypothetical protein [Candidatus Solibacter usitatus]
MAEPDWPQNYFNYYTEIEEHFQRARGTSLFRLSPLDWAMVESWKNAGVPLTAVLRGIDIAFDKWRARRVRSQMINSLAFCAQAVLKETETSVAAGSGSPRQEAAAPFSPEELSAYLSGNAAALRRAGHPEIAATLEKLAGEPHPDLEPLEQHLTALEEKLIAILRVAQSEERLFEARRELDLQLRPYRGKMTAPQIALLERQFLERRLLDQAGLPRLSLFYLR